MLSCRLQARKSTMLQTLKWISRLLSEHVQPVPTSLSFSLVLYSPLTPKSTQQKPCIDSVTDCRCSHERPVVARSLLLGRVFCTTNPMHTHWAVKRKSLGVRVSAFVPLKSPAGGRGLWELKHTQILCDPRELSKVLLLSFPLVTHAEKEGGGRWENVSEMS